MCLGLGINVSPFARIDNSVFDNARVDKFNTESLDTGELLELVFLSLCFILSSLACFALLIDCLSDLNGHCDCLCRVLSCGLGSCLWPCCRSCVADSVVILSPALGPPAPSGGGTVSRFLNPGVGLTQAFPAGFRGLLPLLRFCCGVLFCFSNGAVSFFFPESLDILGIMC